MIDLDILGALQQCKLMDSSKHITPSVSIVSVDDRGDQ
jgi:hypothetical protein